MNEVNSPLEILYDNDDIPFEEEILRNPYSVKHWLRYVEHKSDAPESVINMIYERSLKELPGSYKIWNVYLKLRREQAINKCIIDPAVEDVNNAHERALVFMHKMPRIWIDYCEFLMHQKKITRTRHTFDRSLRSLPVTQHSRIWTLYLKFVKFSKVPETALRIYRRYLKFSPENAEDYIEYLISIDHLDEAAVQLASIVNRENFVSRHGKSNHQLWNELCELISKNPNKVKLLNVDAIIRGGLRKYTDQLGHLWNSLAEYYIRQGLFERARDIYEEAIQTVTTVRDFTQVFDAYAQFEELSLTRYMEDASSKKYPTLEDDLEIELRLARFDDLIERRPLLLNSVLLRQNPHNVPEWHKRVKLLEGKPQEIINTYTEAVQTVDPRSATGKLYTLWVSFAKFYEENNQIDDARIIFDKATQVDDLASVWCEWAEMELRHGNCDEALHLIQRATTPPSRKIGYYDETETVQKRLHKSLKLWSMYADLEESFGTFKTCKAAYDRIVELRIATPQIIINYGMFLEENNYFEEAFKAYEKGVSLFKWPNVYDIWNTYLTKFLERYGGTKLERARDLFEQCLEHCPDKFARNFYLLYAKLEEEYGLARHAMAVYDRSTLAVPSEEQFDMFNVYIRKAAQIYGVTHTREIYEKAIEILPDDSAQEMCLQFADLERKLGEIDRARAIYSHCSQMCDPRVKPNFWQTWKEFEIRHGNEDTMREMLRIKRSVLAMYNTQVNMMSAQMLSSAVQGNALDATSNEDSMKLLESKVASSKELEKPSSKVSSNITFVRGSTEIRDEELAEKAKVQNPDEIDIDEEEEHQKSKPATPDIELEEMTIPSEVFGSLKHDIK